MAFTKTPEQSTYSSERLGTCYSINTRTNVNLISGTVPDERMVNLIPKKLKDSGKEMLVSETRQPIIADQVGSATSAPRGIYVWEKTSSAIYYFAVFGTGIYTSTTGIAGSWTAVTTFATAAFTPVGFTEFLDSSTNIKSLVIVDGVEGYVFTSNAAGTKITDAGFPTPHIPSPIFLDGYLFLAKAGTGDIYNSNLNDPALWTAGDFISSELYPDDITAIVKINNYLLAIGKLGCEYFYDVANATGSPLARYEGASLPFGCPIPSSIAVNKNTVIMLTNNSDGEYVLRLIEDFKHKEIPSNFLISTIEQALLGAPALSSANIRGFFIRQASELYYVLNLDGGLTRTFPCFVYSPVMDTWVSFALGTSYTSGYGNWPVYFSAFGTTKSTITYIQGAQTSGATPSYFFGQLGGSSSVTADDILLLTGSSGATERIYTRLVTPNKTFDTLNAKSCSRFGVECTLSSYGNSETISVSWTDTDFKTTSGTRSLLLTDSTGNYLNFPFITQLGLFRQRSFILDYSGANFIRYKYLELDINKGQQ